jgi:hypothetical protein
MAPSARRSMKPKRSFTRFLCLCNPVVSSSCLFVMNNRIGTMRFTVGTNHDSEENFLIFYRVPLNRLLCCQNIGLQSTLEYVADKHKAC